MDNFEERNMALQDRIRELRLERKWTQKDLADKLGIQQKQISAYERGSNNPSTNILIRLAEAFDVSLDYLAFESQGQTAKVQIKDRELLRYFEAIDKFSEQERKIAKEVLDLIIMKHKFQELAKQY